jgi:hypothetical protein
MGNDPALIVTQDGHTKKLNLHRNSNIAMTEQTLHLTVTF